MAVAVTMTSVLIVSSSWCLKTMSMWLEQYSVLVRRTLIPRTLELVFLQSATINYFITYRILGPVKLTLKMTAFEARNGRLSTRNFGWRAVA